MLVADLPAAVAYTVPVYFSILLPAKLMLLLSDPLLPLLHRPTPMTYQIRHSGRLEVDADSKHC